VVKPTIFAVDDDLAVLNAIVRDLQRYYGGDYRILRANSGTKALEALAELQRRNAPVALFLVDQRMPELDGIEFLTQAIKLHPAAKRAILTAYADTEAAIAAINRVAADYYLLKPWDPPEQQLYPVLDDLLNDWQAGYRPPFEGVRIVGHRWSPDTHELKDFLARNHVPYQYLDVEADVAAKEVLAQWQGAGDALPLVLFADGTALSAPTAAHVAEKIGLQVQAQQPFYDLLIVGAGPAGLAAAVYAASEGLRTVLVERSAPGGQAGSSSLIENYLGFPAGLSGGELARRAVTQARRFGVEILAPQAVKRMRVEGAYHVVTLVDGSEITCHAMVVAVGLSYRKLNAPGIEELTGAGVYYGASLTEAAACHALPVFVVGAGNSAGQAAMHLAPYASKVSILVRGNSLGAKMSQYLVERIEQTPNIEVCLEAEVAAVGGAGHLEQVTILDRRSGARETRPAAALFIFTGAEPQTEWLADLVQRDRYGFVLTGPQLLENGKAPKGWPLERPPYLLESSVPGIFVVGDVRAQSVKRVASAVGEGSIAVQFVHQYLSEGR
jgi:thioredoxin reductase (NADPH)